ncbi:uncharacterized protein LOC117907533 [Vitis riparia]|uniref:uncharacterized protein LOC117907533 n=1 Tax=Vitis riparia TaxID=96939 RepID=UPI00155ADA97|nr:uncharacterized protein LOC117907533 [Vitis riparia]
MEWVALVDNLEAFNKYPWGGGRGICYERALFGLQRALENRVSKYQDKKKAKGEAAVEAYSLVGFPYAFQVWAYEAIPLIGLKYATHVAESYPRILNWSATSAPRSTEVENVFLEPHLTFHSLLTPTLEEQQQDYYKHVDKQGASAEMLHQSNASQDAKKDDLRHEKSSSDTAAYVAAATAAMAEETTNDAVAPSIETGIFEDVTDDEVERNDIPMDVNIDMEASRNLQLAEKHMTKELKDDYSIDDPVIDIAKLFGTPTMSGEFSVYVIPHHLSPAIFKRRREIKKSHILQHPFTDPTKRKKLRKKIEKPLTSFDPLHPISEEALESFQKWMSDDQGSTIDIDYMHIDKKWFQSLSNHGSWLADTHIDVAFFFFRKRRIENPHLFSQKFTTVDTMFWQNAQARWIKHGKKWNQFKLPENDILIDYTNGLQSLYSVKWPDVDIVYVPINVWASHWVLGVVHLHRRIIYVYDSLMGINNNARLQVAIKPLAKLLPHILNAIAYYGFMVTQKLTTRNGKLNGCKIFLNRKLSK